jgi:hypothetical protein
MHRIPGVEECASHHLQHTRLVIHHEDDPGMGKDLTVRHVAAPGQESFS